MLRRNLIIAAVTVLTIGFTVNSFGQSRLKNRRMKAAAPPVKTVQNENKLGNFEIQDLKKPNETTNPQQDGAIRDQPRSSNNRSRAKRNPRNFRPNPMGDGTTTEIYGDVHPGEGDIGSGMVKGQTTPNSTTRRTKRPNSSRIKPPPAKSATVELENVMITSYSQPGQNSGGTISNQVQKPKVARRNGNLREAGSGRATGRRTYKP